MVCGQEEIGHSQNPEFPPPHTKEVRPGWGRGQEAEGVGLPMAFIFFLSMKCRNITSQTTLFNFSSYPILFPVCLQILFISALLGFVCHPLPALDRPAASGPSAGLSCDHGQLSGIVLLFDTQMAKPSIL